MTYATGAAAPSPRATSDGSPKMPPPTVTLKIVAARARTPSARTSWCSAPKAGGSVMAGICGGWEALSGSTRVNGTRHAPCNVPYRAICSARINLPLEEPVMTMRSKDELFEHELKDIYDAEHKLKGALKKLATKSKNDPGARGPLHHPPRRDRRPHRAPARGISDDREEGGAQTVRGHQRPVEGARRHGPR